MNASRERDRWKILAPVELRSRTVSETICRVLETADCLRAEVTLVSTVQSRPFGLPRTASWPHVASGETKPHLSVHRRILTGRPAEAIADYADRTAVNVIVLPPEYCSRRLLFRRSIAMQIAGLTARPMLTLPGHTPSGTRISLQRIACLGRGDASDQRILRLSEAFAARCNADVLTVCDPEANSNRNDRMGNVAGPLIRMVEQQRVGLLIAARPVYLSGKASGRDLLALARHLPCPVLSVPLICALP